MVWACFVTHLKCLGDKHASPRLDQTIKSFQLVINLIEKKKKTIKK
jgi:hypothetical protein